MANEEKKYQFKSNIALFWLEINNLAQEIYEKRVAANKPGDQLSDWLQAEKEIKKQYNL